MKKLKLLGVHGLGDHRGTTWQEDWEKTIRAVFPGQTEVELEFDFLTYDPIFEKVDLSVWESMKAVWKLARSGAENALGRQRGVIGDVSDRVRWTAGYVVAWVEDEEFQRKTRALVFDKIAVYRPDLILAHSLGTLVTYDALAHRDAARADVARAMVRARYVTLGSQLANPFVIGNLAGGRLASLPVKFWNHLYNQEDDVFTAPIKLWDATNFQQVDTPFDIGGFADHSAVEYLAHRNTIEHVYRPESERRIDARAFGALRPRRLARAALAREGRREKRALLVGINAYPDEADRLEGCVNDVFLISSVLQEGGFPPESIRVCLDERATAKGILERLRWLLDDPRPGDERVFYYSGHGATIPQYGENLEPDRKTETLVPWDFDWSPERAIIDDQIFSLYSQLPYETRLAMIFDCCHSGGMHRQGGPKVRGLSPPDDIRHRELRWDEHEDMWVERDWKPLNGRFSSRDEVKAKFFGEKGSTTRLGRASLVRSRSEVEYQREKRRVGSAKLGPYLPLIIEACAEKQLSYEYRHGVTSFGAFTYAACLELRKRKRKRISFERLVSAVGAKLEGMGYDQAPQILGPNAVMRARVPWTE